MVVGAGVVAVVAGRVAPPQGVKVRAGLAVGAGLLDQGGVIQVNRRGELGARLRRIVIREGVGVPHV